MPPGQMGGAPPPIPQPGQASQMAQMGRNGDSVMAHMQPGEIAIPRQVQTPQLLAMLRQAFAQAGLSPQQFTAGSPMASHNPATGAPEFNLLSALLPILGAVGGGIIGGLPTVGIGAPAGAAIGGGLGGAAGGYANGDNTTGVVLSGLGGAAGGYVGGGGLSGAAGDAAASGAASSAGTGAIDTTTTMAGDSGVAAAAPAAGSGSVAGGVGGSTLNSNPFSSGSGGLGGTLKTISAGVKPGLYAGIGSSLGGALAPQDTGNGTPPGFNKPLPAVNPAMARGTANSPTPMFNNYNPYQAVTGPGGGYNFFPNTSSQPGIPP